ncbi:MAG: response regulator [Verrucomicrobiae bacterium]|nr:response regulator [Verrucomicrobiae bacterium]
MAEENLPHFKSILLAEDDELVGNTIRMVLENFGCEVTHVFEGKSAIEAFDANPGKFDLLLTDLNMPKVTGVQLIEAIREKDKALRVVVYSGFLDEAVIDHLCDLDVDCILSKPISLETLKKIINRQRPGAIVVKKSGEV